MGTKGPKMGRAGPGRSGRDGKGGEELEAGGRRGGEFTASIEHDVNNRSQNRAETHSLIFSSRLPIQTATAGNLRERQWVSFGIYGQPSLFAIRQHRQQFDILTPR